jgi:nucleoprotein TPR
LTSIQNSYNALQRTYTDQSRRLAEAHTNISTLTTSAATKKANTSLEYQRLLTENQLLEKRSDEARSVVLEREAELERMANAFEEKEKVWEDRWKKEERIRKEAEKRSEDLKVVVERLALANGEGGDLSPAAALAGGLKAGGKSYTQFYTDYTIQEGKLRAAENEVVRLTLLLDEISQDINEKVRHTANRVWDIR